MKYSDLPSFETLQAYKNGTLSEMDKQWVTTLIQKNEMVRAVVDNMTHISGESVLKIANKTHENIVRSYFGKVGFWSKYGVWIGLSSILLILGLLFYAQSTENEFYHQEGFTLQAEKIETLEMKPVEQQVSTSNMLAETDALNENTNGSEHPEAPEISKLAIVAGELDKAETPAVQKHSSVNAESPKAFEEQKSTSSTDGDNTRSFQTQRDAASEQNIILAIQDVQILAKINPDDLKLRSSNKGNAPYGSVSKSKKGGGYNLEDMPKFAGGDRGLQNYFIGKLHPVNIKKSNDKYDRSVLIELMIKANGKLKDYTIKGNLYPEHQAALEQAIKDLPRFEKGSENITYTIGVSF